MWVLPALAPASPGSAVLVVVGALVLALVARDSAVLQHPVRVLLALAHAGPCCAVPGII